MSLLFEHAIGEFSLAGATLCTPAEAELKRTRERAFPAETVATYASYHASLAHPEEDGWTCIPLHEPDRAELTDEFVAFAEHALHGEIFVYDDGDGREFVPAEEFGATALADRIRFWHSDYVPEETPDYYTSPVAEREPPRRAVADPDGFFDELAGYVESERAAKREGNRERARRRSARDIYREGGDAIPEADCLGRDDRGYRFRVATDGSREDWAYHVENEFGLHEDDEVLVHAPPDAAAPDAFPVAATVERIRGRDVWAAPDWGAVGSRGVVGGFLDGGGEGYGLSLLVNPVPFDREAEAVEAVRNGRFRGVLTGQRDLTFDDTAAVESDPRDDRLNQEQRLAVEHALMADELFCVHGPPGTGKTRTLLEVVRRAVEAGRDVLVCADSNQAVDNLVAGSSAPGDPDERSLHAYGQHGTGEFTLRRVNASRSSRRLVRRAYGGGEGRAEVVAATNSSAARLSREFDLAVVDEATQSTCTASCIPLARARKAVLAGDHRQLPPYSATEEPPESTYGRSLFEHLYADGGVYEGVGVQLKTQYRMHRDVAYFPNREFYDRTLRNGRSVDPIGDREAIVGYDTWGDVEAVDTSRANRNEARLVAYLVGDLLEDGLAPAEVGVITPYRAQVDRIRELLAERLGDGHGVTVDTIDSFQGSERAAVLISMVRHNPEGDVGFLGRPTAPGG